MVRRLAAAMAALSLSLLLVSPALADVPLHQSTPIDWNDATFQGTVDDCTGLNLQPGQVDWHFVLVGATSPDETLTATFGDTFYNVTAISPDKVTDTYVLMWDVVTDQTSLESATATGTAGTLNLSHICAGGPPPDVPEAPATAMLLGAGGLGVAAFFLMRRRAASKLA